MLLMGTTSSNPGLDAFFGITKVRQCLDAMILLAAADEGALASDKWNWEQMVKMLLKVAEDYQLRMKDLKEPTGDA